MNVGGTAKERRCVAGDDMGLTKEKVSDKSCMPRLLRG